MKGDRCTAMKAFAGILVCPEGCCTYPVMEIVQCSMLTHLGEAHWGNVLQARGMSVSWIEGE